MTAPRVAFCFHDPEPTGATVWLRDFLLSGGWPRQAAVLLFPAPSKLADEFQMNGWTVEVLPGEMGALSRAGTTRMARMALNRAGLVGRYRRIFGRHRVAVAYVNTSVQLAPMLAARWAGVPLLVHVHEAWRMGRTHGLKAWAVRHLADAALFAARRGMRLFGPRPAGRRWAFSPNGVDPALAALGARRAEIRHSLGWASDDRMVLFVGTLSRRKGFDDLLRAWPHVLEHVPRGRLVVVGPTDPEEKDPLIRPFPGNAPPRVDALGYRRDARELLAAADLLVLPSRGEAMPIVVSEALMIGTPVVARSAGDIAFQIGRENERGLLFHGSLERERGGPLVEALLGPWEASRRAAAGQAFARERLTRERQNRQVAREITRLARGKR